MKKHFEPFQLMRCIAYQPQGTITSFSTIHQPHATYGTGFFKLFEAPVFAIGYWGGFGAGEAFEDDCEIFHITPQDVLGENYARVAPATKYLNALLDLDAGDMFLIDEEHLEAQRHQPILLQIHQIQAHRQHGLQARDRFVYLGTQPLFPQPGDEEGTHCAVHLFQSTSDRDMCDLQDEITQGEDFELREATWLQRFGCKPEGDPYNDTTWRTFDLEILVAPRLLAITEACRNLTLTPILHPIQKEVPDA